MLRFVDDIAVIVEGEEELGDILTKMNDTLNEYNTKINRNKTKILICRKQPLNLDIIIENEMFETVLYI